VSWYQKGKTNLDLLEQEIVTVAVKICTSLQTSDNHASTPPLSLYRPEAFLPPNQQRLLKNKKWDIIELNKHYTENA